MQAITMVLLVFVLVALTLASARPDGDQYTTKYDNLDLDEILKNKRLLKNYVNCLLNKGTCTPDAAELKKVLPEALATECSKCNEKQKEGTTKVVKYLIENEKEIWQELEKVYDPKGEYKVKYCKRAKEQNIDIKSGCDE